MSALPTAFIEQTTRLLGADECAALAAALAEDTPVSIRLNEGKHGEVPMNVATEPVPWCTTGHYLSFRPSFTLHPLFHAGCYYVQEAASMFVEQALQQIAETPRRVLDLCAAPGGKSTLWRSLLPEGALLVANEPVHQRAMILMENMVKWGHPDVAVTNAWPADFAPLSGFFDVVAADVPCSGEGMFRKDPGAVEEWQAGSAAECAARGWKIISDVWPALREGGYLVYSTCTFNREENEDNVLRICQELGAELIPIPHPAEWGISGDVTGRNLPVYRFFPHRTTGEGFFLALLRRTSPAPPVREKRRLKKGQKTLPISGGRTVAAWLENNSRFKLCQPDADHIVALSENLAEDFDKVCATVRTLSVGILLAETKGRKFVPTTQLALSTALSKTAFPRVELTAEQALNYLRREALALSPETPRGYVVACSEGHPLGFLNNLGARANNLYPAEWRIRKL